MRPNLRRIVWGACAFLLTTALAGAEPGPAPHLLPGTTLPSPEAPLPGPSLLVPATPPLLSEVAHGDSTEQGAFLLSADYLLMTPRSRPLDFAIVGPLTPFGPQGDVRSLDWNVESGFRAGAGYRLPGEGWEASFFYTYLHGDGHNSAVADPSSGVLFPTLTHPGGVEMASVATAACKLNYNVFDLEISRRFHPGEAVEVRVFAGPRAARIDYEINATYNGGDANLDHVRSRIDYGGIGVRAGAESTWTVGYGLGLYARGGASMLASSFRSRLTEATNDGLSTLVDVTDRFHKVVPVLEMGLGLSYQYRGWRLTAGYEFVNWVGLVDQIDFVSDTSVGKPGRRTGDLSLDGLVLRAEWAF
jgi:Legionella pneumophila major outer membrane protein precursor